MHAQQSAIVCAVQIFRRVPRWTTASPSHKVAHVSYVQQVPVRKLLRRTACIHTFAFHQQKFVRLSALHGQPSVPYQTKSTTLLLSVKQDARVTWVFVQRLVVLQRTLLTTHTVEVNRRVLVDTAVNATSRDVQLVRV